MTAQEIADHEAKFAGAESTLDEIVAYLQRVSHRNSVAYDSTYKAWRAEDDPEKRRDKRAHHEQISSRLHEINCVLGCVQDMVSTHRRLTSKASST